MEIKLLNKHHPLQSNIQVDVIVLNVVITQDTFSLVKN